MVSSTGCRRKRRVSGVIGTDSLQYSRPSVTAPIGISILSLALVVNITLLGDHHVLIDLEIEAPRLCGETKRGTCTSAAFLLSSPLWSGVDGSLQQQGGQVVVRRDNLTTSLGILPRTLIDDSCGLQLGRGPHAEWRRGPSFVCQACHGEAAAAADTAPAFASAAPASGRSRLRSRRLVIAASGTVELEWRRRRRRDRGDPSEATRGDCRTRSKG